MTQKAALTLFAGYGIELEYMIVNHETLSVLPVTDELIKAVTGEYISDVERGPLEWSNELALHVIELKTNGPSSDLPGLPTLFHHSITEINNLLEPLGGMLMPTAMHPWMNPDKEMRLWQHDYSPVYEAYNRIFNCRGHGWSNLQSMHINLPFADDEEFGKLHAAIRLILPLLPGIAAASPIADSEQKEALDYRLEVYRVNQIKVPRIVGAIIPEPVFSRAEYEEQIFQPLYKDITPHDPDEIMREEWLNSRGAIARFDRQAIEIRLIDIQECPQADLAIASLVIAVLKKLVKESWSSYDEQKQFNEHELSEILLACIQQAENTPITHQNYLKALGFSGAETTAGALWRHLFEQVREQPELHAFTTTLEEMLVNGTLSTRILKALNGSVTPEAMKKVYGELCECLAENRLFLNS